MGTHGARRDVTALTRSLAGLLSDGLLGSLGLNAATQLLHLFATFQWPQHLEYADYAALYQRGDLAGALVNFWPHRTWTPPPRVTDDPDASTPTPFAIAWTRLARQARLFARLQQADIVCGLGRYSVIVLAFRGGGRPESPLQPGEGRAGLLYAQAYPEPHARILEIERDPASELFGRPKLYEIDTSRGGGRPGDVIATTPLPKIPVHASRVLHLAQDALTGDTYGTPLLQGVYNRLLDTQRILGASALAFVRNARQRVSLQTQEGREMEDADVEKLKERLEEFQSNLREYLWVDGVNVDVLPAVAVDPRPHVEAQVQMIASALRIPLRQLLGSEQAQLASVQDQRSVAATVTERQETLATPWLRTLIDTLIFAGSLPSPPRGQDVHVLWAEQNNLPEDIRAQIAANRAKAIRDYHEGQGEMLVSPEEMRASLGLPPTLPGEVVSAREEIDEDDEGVDDA